MAWEISLHDFAGSTAQSSLKEVTGNTTGLPVDMVHGRTSVTVVAKSTGAIHGRVTLMGSIDGSTWFETATSELVLAGNTVVMSSLDIAMRFARVDLSMASGSGTITAKLMGIV